MVILNRGSLIGKGRGMRTALLCNSLLIHPQCGDNVYRFFVCFFHGGLFALVEDDVGGSGSEAVHYSPSHISNLAGNRATHFCLRAGGRAEGWSAGKRLGYPDGSYRRVPYCLQGSPRGHLMRIMGAAWAELPVISGEEGDKKG